MNWLSDNTWAVWLGAALLFGAVEAGTVDFVFLMLAGGALTGMIFAFLTGSVTVQIVAASLVALLLLVIVRPLLKRHLLDSIPDAGLGVASYVGGHALATQQIDGVAGRAEFRGEIWSARTARGAGVIPPGHDVVVTGLDGATLIVESARAETPTPQEP